MSIAEVLPQEMQLEFRAAEQYSDLHARLDEIYTTNYSFVDPHAERTNPKFSEYVERYIREMGPYTTDELPDVRFAVANALYFSHTMASLLSEKTTLIVDEQLFVPLDDDSIIEKLTYEGQMYLARRPTLDGMIDAFLPEIDPSFSFPQLSSTVAALTLQQAEHGIRTAYTEGQIAAFSSQLEALDINSL